MVAVVTNYGKAAPKSALYRGVMPDGSAIPSNFYLILYTTSYTPDPDHGAITDLGANALDPANYSGNSIARASGSWASAIDDLNDESILTSLVSPSLAASANLNNAKGYALCTANNLTTAKVLGFYDFSGGGITIGAGSSGNITMGAIRGQAAA